MMDSNAKRCLAICPLFEAELLLHLMLSNWQHPFANDEAFRQGLLECATELLLTASHDDCEEVFIEGLKSSEMNFVAAVWYAEWCGAQDDSHERESRNLWLKNVRRSLPSCFCSTDLLGS
ncbi:MAG: hypothetical protein WCI02_00490 [Planctomycetota bacterium]